MRKETPWGVWDAIGPAEAAALMRGFPGWWCIAGGYAIDAFCGRPGRREHDDVDISLLARDHLAAQRQLAGWQLHAAGSGNLALWPTDTELPPEIHDIWARRDDADAWRFQLMLNPAEGDDWLYRRDPRVRRPLASMTFELDGIPYLVPEVQLLFKSKSPRSKDEQDFADALPLLDARQRRWLGDAVALTDAGNAWLPRL